jgi:serine protease AprX
VDAPSLHPTLKVVRLDRLNPILQPSIDIFAWCAHHRVAGAPMAKRKQPTSSVSGTPSAVQDDPTAKPFTPETLDRTIIALPLLDKIRKAKPSDQFDIIIDVNLEYAGGRAEARKILWQWVDALPDVRPLQGAAARGSSVSAPRAGKAQGIDGSKSKYSQQYLFGRLSADNIRALVQRNEEARRDTKDGQGRLGPSALYRIWQDDEVRRFTNLSISTVKADAARNAFSTSGKDIVWAVVDTGIDREHPHFKKYQNLELSAPLCHRDFTESGADDAELAKSACIDRAGHGTHVAGIIAGECMGADGHTIVATVRRRVESGDVSTDTITDIPLMCGMAPQCKLLSLKVLNDTGNGLASNLIAALEYIQELNGGGRRIRVHGVNMSVGYDFEPKWFACGQSPLCVEVDRLVRSGVVVVVAAGNTGYGYNQTLSRGPAPAGQDVTINDPGNSELAITVGSTHREMPHVYGVSYFSSKGPTGDGRLKPDMVAPGEKIISCQSGNAGPRGEAASGATPADTGASGASTARGANAAYYKEDSGTSMAAPHVSGVIAAFLSVRREFIGNPEAVKRTFMSTATDLKRAVYFQGAGLVDLMRAIQSV